MGSYNIENQVLQWSISLYNVELLIAYGSLILFNHSVIHCTTTLSK